MHSKIMIQWCMCIYGVGTIAKVDVNINAEKYIQVLDDHLWPVIAIHFPSYDCDFQDENAPVHRARQ